MDEFKKYGELVFAYYRDPETDELKLHLAAKVKSLPPTEELLFYHPEVDARDTQTTNSLTRAHAKSDAILQKIEAQSQNGSKSFVEGGVVLARSQDPEWYYLGVISSIHVAKYELTFHVNFLHDDSWKWVSRDEVRPMTVGQPCKRSGEMLLPYFPSKGGGITKHFKGDVKWPRTPAESKKRRRGEDAPRRSRRTPEEVRMARAAVRDEAAESQAREFDENAVDGSVDDGGVRGQSNM